MRSRTPPTASSWAACPKWARETCEVIDAAGALPAWRAPPPKALRYLRRWFELMMEHQDDLARLMTWTGKPWRSKSEIYAASFIEWFAERESYGDTFPVIRPISA
ncbi:MAG: aldehyde dehydrogenase family protein [Enterobacteriaceae bacterium]